MDPLSSAAAPQSQEKVRILVVEDSKLQADLLEYVLTQHGYQVSSARDGLEAFEMIESARPFIVISDIVMPVMDGFELCRRVKSDRALKEIPVILLTALSDPEDVLKGLECGADGFVTKPYNEDYLLTQISRVILNRHMRGGSDPDSGVEIHFKGQKYVISSERRQILDLLISTYETAVMKNHQLRELKEELEVLNENLEKKVDQRTTALVAEIAERKKAEEELRKHREHLQELVDERTRELKSINEKLCSEIAERKEAENKIQRLNVDLEKHARHLEDANKDLEGFSYSVSHDLKAPLRAIEGFSQILAERFGSDFQPEAARMLGLVRENARRMNQLIDEILAFSKAGCGEIRTGEIDIEGLVRSLIEELRPMWDGRAIAFRINTLSPACGDAGAVRQVFFNLISNSIKFTRPKESATIELNSEETGDEVVYCVRDNGVGFEEKDAGRLFGIFRRLHSPKEFEGTGIGLAIVKRIIGKLGGRVWAKGVTDEGASFYFSLPRVGARLNAAAPESCATNSAK